PGFTTRTGSDGFLSGPHANSAAVGRQLYRCNSPVPVPCFGDGVPGSSGYFAIDDCPEHLAAIAIVVVIGFMHADAVVPDYKGAGVPAQTAAEFFARDMSAEKVQQALCFFTGQAFNAKTVNLIHI